MSRVLYLLLGVVASAAAVLSFDALLGLATLCGFRPALAWLLPVTVDAGAAAGSLAWLTRPLGPARRFGRVLALALLGGSVAGNALGHGLDAYLARPAWWVVVAVSAVPPAVLGAVVHLAVLHGREPAQTGQASIGSGSGDDGDDDRGPDGAGGEGPPGIVARVDELDEAGRAGELLAEGAGRRRLARELGVSEHAARELIAAHRYGGGR